MTARNARYKQTPKGKAANRRYVHSVKGKATRARYARSAKAKTAQAQYLRSPAGKAMRAGVRARHKAKQSALSLADVLIDIADSLVRSAHELRRFAQRHFDDHQESAVRRIPK